MRKILSMLLCLVLMLSVATTVFAESSVTYDGNARSFIFAPGTELSPTNLFPSFEGVFPGDVLTEQITIKNDVKKDVKVKVYLRSLGAQEGTDEFLSKLNLSVTQSGDSYLFDAPANETAQLTEWTCLGTVYSGGEILLNVTLEVPITLDNSYQGEIGYVDWQFKVEEFPAEPDDPKPPKTGDDSQIFLYAGLMVVCLLVILLLLRKRKEKQEEK